MPITGKSGYLATIDSFLTHWQSANRSLGTDGPLTIRTDDGSTINLPALKMRRSNIASSLQELQDRILDASEAAQILNYAQRAMIFRCQSLIHALRADSSSIIDLQSLPEYPRIAMEREVFLQTVHTLGELWQKINSVAPRPLILRANDRFSQFQDEFQNLEGAWTDAETTKMILAVKRQERDVLLSPVPGILTQYQIAVRALFPDDSDVLRTLPDVYTSHGCAPLPVKGRGGWDAAARMGHITWEEAREKDDSRYEVRYSPGNRYEPDAESVIATRRRRRIVK